MQNNITPQWMIEQGFSPSFAGRFWNKVDKSGDCWIWTAFTDRDGYGEIRVSGLIRDGSIKAHRASWMLANDKLVPAGMMVLHGCLGGGNPSCVNPDHLRIGTHADNMKEMVAAGRNKNLRKAVGENVSTSKLTTLEVIEIRNLCQSESNLSEIARRYGVTHSTIKGVTSRATWKHVS